MDTAPIASIPVFPLPDYFLFPAALAPLHIFEQRYRQMIADLMDRAGRLVLTSIPSRWPRRPGEPPRLLSHGCLAEIMRHEKLADGRYLILVLGLSRARIEEVESKRLYRSVQAQPLAEVESSPTEESELRPRLEQALLERGGQRIELARPLPIGMLADTLLQMLPPHPEHLEAMIAEPEATRRARAVLAWSGEETR